MTHFLFANTYSSVRRCKHIVTLFWQRIGKPYLRYPR